VLARRREFAENDRPVCFVNRRKRRAHPIILNRSRISDQEIQRDRQGFIDFAEIHSWQRFSDISRECSRHYRFNAEPGYRATRTLRNRLDL